MSDVTHILSAIEAGDPSAAEQLLPLVYLELRRLAASKLAQERPGQTLQATALVHEAYLRLVGSRGFEADDTQHFDGRGHFFAAAAEAMRRILVDDARRKRTAKHGGQVRRQDVDVNRLAESRQADEILAVDEALARLAQENPTVARLVNLRYFAGMTLEEAAGVLQISVRTAHRYWDYARAWLHHEISLSDSSGTN